MYRPSLVNITKAKFKALVIIVFKAELYGYHGDNN